MQDVQHTNYSTASITSPLIIIISTREGGVTEEAEI